MPKSVTYVVGICVTHVPESTRITSYLLVSLESSLPGVSQVTQNFMLALIP